MHIPDLHVITDTTRQARFDHEELAACAVDGGATAVQFREKRPRTTRALVDVAARMRDAIDSRAVLVVNDRVDVAVAVGAGGVHLGDEDLDARVARRIARGTGGATVMIGRTANDVETATRIVHDGGVDYLGVGPVFGTTSKASPAPTLGLDGLRAIVAVASRASVPVIAIGSITADRVADVLAAGAHGVAVLSAVACADDPIASTHAIRAALDAARSSV